ncbi:MAG: penicillin-binding protein 2 [Rhodospirillales bacterium]|nr:penicillin-binding protein 2 [Rhodospirillales bacterium]MCW9002831.1 penicillin-binding protein 2 [Rhodospirillales bacterium]
MTVGHGALTSDAGLASGRVRVEGIRKQALDTSHNRLVVLAVVFGLLFVAISARVIDLTVLKGASEPTLSASPPSQALVVDRASILDRRGILVASSLPTASLYVNPRDLRNAGENPETAAARLVEILPDLSQQEVARKLSSDRSFVYLRRNLAPRQQYQVNRLGIAGVYFQREERRVYPHGPLLAHVLGMTDVDGKGISGLEKQFDDVLRRASTPLQLSLDVTLQQILRDELLATKRGFDAVGAAGVIMDVNSGEVLALASLPDFDPNNPDTAQGDPAFNRATKGVYEMGSTFKLFNTAMALDSGVAKLTSRYDATQPLKIARFAISDFHPKNRWLSLPEILFYSSNIGSARIALDVGATRQKAYMEQFGLMDRASIELPEVGTPLLPSPWRDINVMTASYGHGIAVTPLQLAAAVSAVVNGGILRPATLLKRDPVLPLPGERVITEKTSDSMRKMMRLVVRAGTAGKADAKGYRVGGKTGTAEKLENGRYRKDALISSFVGVFPMDAPRYVVLVVIDEPKGKESTFGYATGGWVAAPAVGRIVNRIAPVMGIAPSTGPEPLPKAGDPMFVAVKAAM